MASEFDRLMQQADDTLFKVFGEDRDNVQPTYTAPGGMSQPIEVEVMLNRNAQLAGADGMFRMVQYLAELRVSQVRGKRGGRLQLADGAFLLDDMIDTDGLVERWSLLPQ